MDVARRNTMTDEPERTSVFRISGVTCEHCAEAVAAAIENSQPHMNVNVPFVEATAQVLADGHVASARPPSIGTTRASRAVMGACVSR